MNWRGKDIMERQPLNDMFVNNNISRRLMLKLGGAGLLGAGLVACGSPSTATSGSPTRGGTLQMAQVADNIPRSIRAGLPEHLVRSSRPEHAHPLFADASADA